MVKENKIELVGQVGRTVAQRGVALLIALLFVAVLSAIIVAFTYEVQVDASLVENSSGELEAYVAAKSAVAQAMGMLIADLEVAVDNVDSGQEIEVHDSLDEEWAGGIPAAQLNDAIMAATIADEYGKLNLNALVRYEDSSGGEGEGEGEINEVLVEALQVILDAREAEEGTINAIIDWLDPDDDPVDEKGAEYDYYGTLDLPYACKNGPANSVEELLLIPGVTPEIFFGDPEKDEIPLTELLTIHGHPDGKINVNTAEPEVLEAVLLATGRGTGLLDRILERREEGAPYESEEDLIQDGLNEEPKKKQNKKPVNNQQSQNNPQQNVKQAPSPTNPPTNPPSQSPTQTASFENAPFCVSSDVFRIQADGVCGDVRVRVEAYVWRNPNAVQYFDSASGTKSYGLSENLVEGVDERVELMRILDWREIR